MKHRVIHFERIDSTNAEAHRLAQKGERGPLWLWADEQTGGRGRLGRTWVSEPGNFYATFLFSTSGGAEVATQVSFVAALAVHDLAAALLPRAKLGIKWPNDVLVDGAKFCGLLAEVLATHPTAVALGCGINVARAPKGMAYPVTALAHHGKVPALGELLQMLDTSLSDQLAVWNEGSGFATIRGRWMKHALGIGREAVAMIGGKQESGIFRGLASDGALILEFASGAQKHIHAGDVRFALRETLS
ncbi:MAG: biotin--[acetyl-CoA-carboxylase] ligase [Methylocella sp.]